jgi:site-specific recombinase XerD
MINESWMEDEAFKNWFESIGLRKTRTLRNYKREFPKFLEWIKQTPSEIIKNRLEDLRSVTERHHYESVVVKYKNYLETQTTDKGTRLRIPTIHGYLRCVQSFFSHNDVKLMFRRGELKVEPSEQEKVYRKWILDNSEVRHLYRNAKTPRDRALILVLYQSGFSPIDVSEMKIEDFHLVFEGKWIASLEMHMYHMRRREKTNIWQETCISIEALEDIQMMLAQRGNPDKGNLFVSFRNKPLSPREINLAIKSIVKRAYPNRIKEFKTKHLRDSYKNGLVQAKIPQEAIDCMFGHQRRGARKDYQLTESTTRLMYQEAWKFLRINGFSSKNKVEEIRKELKEDIGTLAQTLTQEIKNLKEQLEAQKQETEHYIEQLVLEYYKKQQKQ